MTDTDGGLVNGAKTSYRYEYDAYSNRTEKKESGKESITYRYNENNQLTESTQSGKTEHYRTNEQQTVTETLDASGDVMAAYVYDEFGVLTEIRTPETKTAKAEKALEAGKGNGRDLEKAQSQQTEPAGRIEPEDEFFAYTGCLYDGSTGLYYAKDRYYDAEAGRFISKDRCENDSSTQDSLNRYVYVGNNPIKYTDPSGETAAVVAAGAAGTVAIPLSAVLTLAIVVLGVTTLIEVTGSYLKTPEGQRLLKRASKVLYDGKEYAVGLFKKIAHWVGAETKARFAKIKKAAKKIWDWIRGAEKTGGTQASAGAIELLSKKVREEQKGKSNNAKGKGNTKTGKKDGETKKRSKYPPARRIRTKSKKEAYEAAKRAGKGKEPKHHPNDPGQDPHYHPNVNDAHRTTPQRPSYHDHYYYPK